MVKIIPFAAIRPRPSEVASFACPPYDVLSRTEATALAPTHRFLEVIRPEVALPAEIDEDAPQAHAAAATALADYQREGVLAQDSQPTIYAYRQEGYEHVQTGIVACVRVADYRDGVIKQHERTLVAKEQNRIHHFEATNAQTEPVFLMYRPSEEINAAVAAAISSASPEYDFTSEDGVRHQFWALPAALTEQLVAAFSSVEALYIADGHHRSASAVKVAGARGLDADDPRASIMAVIFPANDLKVLAYNRVVADLGGLSPAEFLAALKAAGYTVTTAFADPSQAQPRQRGEFGVYVGSSWYRASYEGKPSGDPVADLDTSILTRTVLQPILGIEDLRTNPRISFVGGSAGIAGLEAEAGRDGVAFSLFPTSVTDVMAVSDDAQMMPPKSTWFEPKLASGLFIHSLA